MVVFSGQILKTKHRANLECNDSDLVFCVGGGWVGGRYFVFFIFSVVNFPLRQFRLIFLKKASCDRITLPSLNKSLVVGGECMYE